MKETDDVLTWSLTQAFFLDLTSVLLRFSVGLRGFQFTIPEFRLPFQLSSGKQQQQVPLAFLKGKMYFLLFVWYPPIQSVLCQNQKRALRVGCEQHKRERFVPLQEALW